MKVEGRPEEKPLLLGCHLSITKGLDRTADLAFSIGASAFQFFTRNPRGGAARSISPEEINRWQKRRAERGISYVVGHLPYTVNLAAFPGKLQDFARMVIKDDLRRVGEIGGEALVCHPGHHGGDRPSALKRIAETLHEAFESSDSGPCFCLESMALQGKEIGSLDDMEELLSLLHGHPRLGIWLDTAHLFAAGWELRTTEGCERLLEKIQGRVGLERVWGVHLNDSREKIGSHRDRHAAIGAGEIGQDGIATIIKNPWLAHLPLILETPVTRYDEYGPEIALVKSLAYDKLNAG